MNFLGLVNSVLQWNGWWSKSVSYRSSSVSPKQKREIVLLFRGAAISSFSHKWEYRRAVTMQANYTTSEDMHLRENSFHLMGRSRKACWYLILGEDSGITCHIVILKYSDEVNSLEIEIFMRTDIHVHTHIMDNRF